MTRIFLREFSGFLHSLVAWIVMAVFLVGIGLPSWIFPETSILDYGYADLGTLFNTAPYLLMFLVPAVTMRTFAEERRTGTLEFLMTRPVATSDVLLGKFLACWSLAVVALIPAWTYYYSVFQLGNPAGNIDTSGFIGSWIGLVLLAGVFTSFGVLASVLTPNQIVSFLASATVCFVFYSGLDAIAGLEIWGNEGWLVRYLGLYEHYESLGRGLIDSRDLVYFASLAGVNLVLAGGILESRKW